MTCGFLSATSVMRAIFASISFSSPSMNVNSLLSVEEL